MKMMDFSEKQKIMAGAGAVLLTAFLIFFPEGDVPQSEAGEKKAVAERDTAVSAPKGRWKILGDEKAEAAKEIRNPFHLLHESREEDIPRKESLENLPNKIQPAIPDGKNDAGMKPVPVQVSEKTAWQLKGIVSGQNGSLAILSNGKETKTLGIGQDFDGWVLQEISGNRVVLSADGREECLYLKGI